MIFMGDSREAGCAPWFNPPPRQINGPDCLGNWQKRGLLV